MQTNDLFVFWKIFELKFHFTFEFPRSSQSYVVEESIGGQEWRIHAPCSDPRGSISPSSCRESKLDSRLLESSHLKNQKSKNQKFKKSKIKNKNWISNFLKLAFSATVIRLAASIWSISVLTTFCLVNAADILNRVFRYPKVLSMGYFLDDIDIFRCASLSPTQSL